MISRATLAVDRFATLLLALALIAGGALGIWWWTGDSSLPTRSDTGQLQDLVGQSWWPWASAIAGLVLILLGVRWIASHVRTTKVKRLNLKGSGSEGRLGVDGTRVAGAAADAFTDTLGVRSAKGSVRHDRGQIVANLSATIEPEADLHQVAEQADLVSAELAQVLGREDLRCSVELTVARIAKPLERVT